MFRHDDGVVTTQFQQAPTQPSGYRFGHGLAHARAARGRHQSHAGVAGQPLARFAPARDEARHPFGYVVVAQHVANDLLAG